MATVRSTGTKAPVGLLSGRAVLRKQDGRALPRQAPARSRSILMESLYFYNFLYGSFIYSMLIFMHTDR